MNMSDYIKREDAIYAVCQAACHHKPCNENSYCHYALAIKNILACDHVYGYPIKDLIAFAIACRKNGVEYEDLKTFAHNVEFGISIARNEMDEALNKVISDFRAGGAQWGGFFQDGGAV